MNRVPKPLPILPTDNRGTREIKQYLMDVSRYLEETAITAGGGLIVRKSVSGCMVGTAPPKVSTMPFAQRIYHNIEHDGLYLEVLAGYVHCTSGGGAVAKYDELVQNDKWYFVQAVVQKDGTAPTITGTVQVGNAAPAYATDGATTITYKVVLGTTDQYGNYTSEWPGGDIYIEEGIPPQEQTRNLDFLGTEDAANVTIQAGHVRIYDTTTAVTGLTLPLNAPTDVWVEIVSTGSTTPSVTVTNILQSGTFPGVVQLAAGSVKVCRKIGYIAAAHWYQEHEGEVNDLTYLLHAGINAAYQYGAADYGWNTLTPKTTNGAVTITAPTNKFFDGATGGLKVAGGSFKEVNPAGGSAIAWGGATVAPETVGLTSVGISGHKLSRSIMRAAASVECGLVQTWTTSTSTLGELDLPDELVKCSDDDTAAGYLENKLTDDNKWIDIGTGAPPGGDEQVAVSHIGPWTSHKGITVSTPTGTTVINWDEKGHIVSATDGTTTTTSTTTTTTTTTTSTTTSSVTCNSCSPPLAMSYTVTFDSGTFSACGCGNLDRAGPFVVYWTDGCNYRSTNVSCTADIQLMWSGSRWRVYFSVWSLNCHENSGSPDTGPDTPCDPRGNYTINARYSDCGCTSGTLPYGAVVS